ncbi:MAG TPA: aminopeptidase [Gemmatimonadaceae bacterium]|nr:aminopeptidase [Gemmatimonadaceae bacterium]
MKIRGNVRRRIGVVIIALGAVLKASLFLFPFPRFLARAALEEAKILWRRTPIAAGVTDSSVPPNERAKLTLVLAARDFAGDSLGLPAGKLFTAYSRVDRDTLLLLLSAARQDTLALHRWWFPIIGYAPYKGFFDFKSARDEEGSFQRRGYDTDLRPAAAFSTLGWFDDPLLSTTLRQDSLSLVNTVVHELTHNRLFVKGQVEFNESFASFVGSRGASAFFRARGDTTALQRSERRWLDDQARVAYFGRLLASLDSAYAAHPGDRMARVEARDVVYRRYIDQLVDSLTKLRGDSVARRVQLNLRLNNASLLARRVYGRDLPVFDSVHAALGDLRATIDSISNVATGSSDPFAALRSLLKRARSKEHSPRTNTDKKTH